MAVERESAVINNPITLRCKFRFTASQALFDPSEISKVEILDSDEVTVLETLTGASIVKDSTGQYHVVATAIATPKTIHDRWYYTHPAGAAEIYSQNSCVVYETSAAAGTVVLDTTPAGMLAAVNTAIAQILAGGAVVSYTIAGRSLQKMSLNELYDLKLKIERSISATAGRGRNHVKFMRPT
jgi:hypothetical protein